MTASGSPQRTRLTLFRALVELSDECMAARMAEAAYHALAAAMHCAEDAEDLAALDVVINLAERRQAELNAKNPPHPLAASQASLRGTTPVFESLVLTAKAVQSRLHAEAARMKGESRREDLARRAEARRSP